MKTKANSSKAVKDTKNTKDINQKSLKEKSVLNPKLLSNESKQNLLNIHNEAKPYKHLFIENMFDDEFLREVQNESVTNLKATFKESDLFKVFQTIDMGNLDSFSQKEKKKMK